MFVHQILLVFSSWTPWSSHGVTGRKEPTQQHHHGMTGENDPRRQCLLAMMEKLIQKSPIFSSHNNPNVLTIFRLSSISVWNSLT